jgi:hypothetical protein
MSRLNQRGARSKGYVRPIDKERCAAIVAKFLLTQNLLG